MSNLKTQRKVSLQRRAAILTFFIEKCGVEGAKVEKQSSN